MQNLVFAWGKQGDDVKHIDEVQNGLACNCTCPQCGGPLIARNKGKIKRSHFAHATDMFCAGAVETGIHLAAKRIINESDKILTPKFKFPYGFESTISAEKLNEYGSLSNRHLKYEKSFEEISVRNFRSDNLLISGDKKIFIEITVTNETKDTKILDFQKNGDLLFEIDLSQCKEKADDKNFLKEEVLSNQKNRKWLVINENFHEKSKLETELKASSHRNKIEIVSKKFTFNGGPDNFARKLNDYLMRFNKNDKGKVNRLLKDLDQLNRARIKDWRKQRVQFLKWQDENSIKEINRLIKEGKVDKKLFCPNISNVWVLDTHSHIWQYDIVTNFFYKRRLNTKFHIDYVTDRLEKSYQLIPFLKRINNWNFYGVDKKSELFELMSAITNHKTEKVPFIPDFFSVSLSYLDALTKKKVLNKSNLVNYEIDSAFIGN